jgi:hypothetical protein
MPKDKSSTYTNNITFLKGKRGKKGDAGLNGIHGLNGITGSTGPDGINGIDGSTGPAGTDGPIGPNGPLALVYFNKYGATGYTDLETSNYIVKIYIMWNRLKKD